MSSSSELHSYVARLQQRLRLDTGLRGAAIFTGTGLTVTLVLVFVLNHFAFPARGVIIARLAIALALEAVAAFGIAVPLVRLTRIRAVERAEVAQPNLQQRLTTFAENAAKSNEPFLELLAADTLKHTSSASPAALIPNNRLCMLAGAGLGCMIVLLWMIAAAPGFIGYGAALIWTGPKKDAAPLYAISVAPGDLTVRRNSDQLILAHVTGMQPTKAELFAHFASSAGWEPVAMRPQPNVAGGIDYQFVFAGIPENVEYYVAAGPLISSHFKLRVVDLPSIKQIDVTYHYPTWTGMKPVTEEHSGDLRAIEGTDAELAIRMDRSLRSGQLALDGGQTIVLTGGANNVYHAIVHMDKDGAYHLAGVDDGQPVRLSEDYFIATDKAEPPQISIERPAGDYRASPIEEVTVGVNASDEFGLNGMHLHYSVNGGADHDVNLLNHPSTKEADSKHMIALEDLKLVPGDVIAIYAAAQDGHSTAQTDISFIQVDPFEREFSQSQQSGGGGGGGGGGGAGNQTEISKREKELIAATWKQQNDKTATPKDNAAQGQFLSDAQQKLRDQVNALSVRMQSRDISEANQEFTDFDKDMQAAAEAMSPAAGRLQSMQWKDALPLEQKALQALLRAEATFRRIEVAFGQRSGGGGSGGGNAGRDLASLFDLELDTEKNQYETAQTAPPAEQHEKELEDTLAKLDALARRQEDLANQSHDPQQSFQQRWQQEMLRREAEELQQQMEQMAKSQQQNQQSTSGEEGSQSSQQDANKQGSSGQQSGGQPQGTQSASGSSLSGSASAQSSGSSQDGSQQQNERRDPNSHTATGRTSGQPRKSSDQPIEEALSRLNQATEMMKRNGTAQENAEDARQAAERLREAQNVLAGSQQQLASGKLDSMAREAGRLAQEERAQAGRIDKLAQAGDQNGNGDSPSNLDDAMARLHERDQLAADRQQLSDDLSKLQSSVRNSARELASNQPDIAKELRDALTQMDESDLGNHVQRTADWLRSGVNPNSNGTESEIARGFSKLNDQLQQAQRAMAQAKPDEKAGQHAGALGDQTAALDQVERLRSELESMAHAEDRERGIGPNQNGAQGRQRSGNDQLSRNGRADEQNGADQPLSRNGSRNGQGSEAANDGGGDRRSADGGRDIHYGYSGDTRADGGRGDGTVWGNYDTGNNTPHARGRQQAAPSDASGNPADTERMIQQELRQLHQLRQMVRDNPQAAKDVDELTRQMQNLDPSRFPGNPVIVERMHHEVLSSVDRLELQLQHDGAATDARMGKPDAVPAGYQEQVADYYRRLSKKQ
jgi:hypothetical protein